ncbi:MAG: HAD family hydrolase [Erysipelotrichaceae bacterium]|nr:HAD family hydrolase [Erysipelotrichaceae bacterium]
MNKKYIFMDVDGTILDHSIKGVRESTKKALKIMQDKGYDLYICTGRNYPTAKYDLGIEPKGYVLSMGALVRTDDKILYQNPFDEKLVKKILAEAPKYDIELNLETEVYCYATKETYDYVQEFFDELTKEYWIPFELYKNEKIYKMMISGHSQEGYDNFKKLFSEKMQFQNSGRKWYDEMQLIDNSKGSAIKKLAQLGYINLKDTVVIGDGLNDISMFNIGAYSIAMGNAEKELKNCADYVTDDITTDGFYKAFEKLGYLD